jgi:hypothetical protein
LAALYGLETGEIDTELIQNLGRHYTVLSFGLSQIFTDDLSFSTLWQASWTDLSGFISPSISYRFFDGMSISAGLLAAYGDDDTEYGAIGLKNTFGDLQASLTLNLGGGRF